MRISDWSSAVCSSDLLYLRHHWAAEGGTARAPRLARPSARRRDAAVLLPAAGRPVLDAGRLGLDRRALGCFASRLAPRRAGGGAPPSQVRSGAGVQAARRPRRSEEHTSELQSLMRISYAVFCLKKKKHN